MVREGGRSNVALRALIVVGVLVANGSCNRFQEAWVMNCDHTFPDGTTYDLTAMTRTAGRSDYVGRDKLGNMYYMNVCGNVQEIPKECKALQKSIRSPVYQVRNDSYCHWLGVEQSHAWDYIEPGSPFVGVQITYNNGEYCQEGVNRQVKLQFYCDHLGRLGTVGDYYVTQEAPCTWVVTFPTPYGCPKGTALSQGSLFVVAFCILFTGYCGGGLLLNMTKFDLPLGPDALPHISFWRGLPELVKEGAAFTADSFLVKLGRREAREGGSFEWSGL
mmetsp:Transcript_60877/g.89229  ORF Transcript_60877/g.89229 Transcript_60877/m.89229 type:complete len:275 (-) Transcript_60877:96-920(-)